MANETNSNPVDTNTQTDGVENKNPGNKEQWKEHFGALADFQEEQEEHDRKEWKGHFGELTDLKEEQEKHDYKGWKEHFGPLADMEEARVGTTPQAESQELEDRAPHTTTDQNYKSQQEDLIQKIDTAVKNYDTQGAEAAREEYNQNLDQKNQQLYQQHKTEAEGLTDLQQRLDEEKNKIKDQINQEQEDIDTQILLQLIKEKRVLKEKMNSSPALKEAQEVYKEDSEALREIALKEMNESLMDKNAEEAEIELGEARVPEGDTNPTDQEQEEATPETNRRSERWRKIYKLIGTVTKIATGGGLGTVTKIATSVGGGMLGISAGALAAATSPVWLGIAGAAGLGLVFGGKKLTDFALGRIFTQEGYHRLEKELQNAIDETKRREKQEELERRRKNHESLREYSNIALKSAGFGLIIGGVSGLFVTGGETLAGSEAVSGGETAVPMGEGLTGGEATPVGEGLTGGEATPVSEGLTGPEGAATEILTPDTVNVYDFAGGSDSSYMQYIESLKAEGRLLGDNLLLTENLGGTFAEAQGELLKTLHQQGIPTNQINGQAFMEQILELNKSIMNNQPFNIQNMAEVIKNASLGGV